MTTSALQALPLDCYHCLVVDPSPSVEPGWPLEEGSGIVRACYVRSGEAAMDILSPTDSKFIAVVINPWVNAPGLLKLISKIHTLKPATPIFLMETEQPAFTGQDFVRMAIHGVLAKPLRYGQLVEKVPGLKPLLNSPAMQKALSSPEKPAEPPVHDDEYTTVPASDYLGGSPSFFDVYIRLPSGKFLKVLEANDSFEADRVAQFIQKGVTHFYVSRTSHGRCVDYCDSLAKVLLESSGTSDEMRVAHMLAEGDEIVAMIRKEELRDVHVDYLVAYVSSMHRMIHSANVLDRGVIDAFLSNMESFEHAVSITAVASLLALPLKIENEQTFRAVGMAAMLHDIGLYPLSVAVQTEDESVMSPSEIQLYHSHPILGSEMLRKMRKMDEIIVQAVLQHHERLDGSGFPHQIPAPQLNMVSQIVGISDEFVRAVQKKKKDPQVDVLKEMESRYSGFSENVVKAFKEVFADAHSKVL